MRRGFSRAGVLLAAVPLALSAAVLSAPAASAVQGWTTLGSDVARPLDESQGLATVVRPDGVRIRYTGIGTVDPGLAAQGWNHIGDPGTTQGYYVEPYQRDDDGGKLFRVEAPDGSRADYTHALAEGEALNNSFAAGSPDGRWLVGGEFGTMDRLLVYPMPGIAATDPGANLPLAARITLDRPVRDIQGCDFAGPTRLLCSSDDPAGELFGVSKPLLQLDLPEALSGVDITAKVTSLGQLPLESGCQGGFETEGIDYDERDGTLRVVVMSPSVCVAIDSKTWRFRED